MYSFRRSFLLVVLITASFSVLLLSPVDSQAQKANVDFDPNIVYIKPGDTSEKSAKVRLTESPAVSVTVKLEVAYQNSGNSNSYVELSGFPQSLTFTKDNYSAFQEFRFKATGQFQVNNLNLITAEGKEGDKRFSGGLSISIGEGPGSRTVGKVITDPEVGPTYIYSDREKKNIKIKLSIDPVDSVKIRITQPADNNGAITLNKREFTFTSANYNTFQSFEIAVNPQNKTRESELIIFEGSNSKTYFKSGLGVAVSGVIDANFSGGTGAAGFGSPLGALISEETGFVYQAWRVTRSVINILLIIALFAISFSNITRINIDTYTIKKALPNLVIGIILANASLYIIRFMSDITTVVTYFFVNQVGSTTFADFIGDTAELIGRNTLETIGWGVGLLAPLLIFLFALVTIIGLLWLAFLLYFRLVAIYLLTILSPLAFVSYGIPGFDKYFKQWWQQFTKWLFILPAMSAVFWLMLVIGEAGESESIERLLIMYVLFFTALTLPSKMGGAVIDKASKAFMKYSGAGWARDASLNAAKDYAQQKGQQIGYRLPGVARYQAWRDLQKENAKKDIEQLKKRGRNKILEGKTGRNYEKLKLLDKEISLNEEEILARKEVEAGNLKGGRGFRNDESISERLLRAEYQKKLEEEKKNYNDGIERLEFVNSDNDEVKDLLKKVFKATIDQEVVSKEVGRAEGMQKGNIATGYLQPLQAAANYSQLRSELKGLDVSDPQYQEKKTMIEKAMNDIKTSFEALKKREGNEEYAAFKDLDDFMIAYDPDDDDKKDPRYDKYKKELSTQIRVWQGRQRQTSKMFNEGIASQIETDVKEQTVAQLERELKGYLNKELKGNAELHKLFMRGDTAALSAQGIEDKDIRAGRAIMEKYKQLMRSTNDIRNRDALNSFVATHNEVLAGTGHEFSQQLIEDAASSAQQDRRAAAGHIAQESGIISGQPHYANQNGKPLKPNPYQRKKGGKATVPPPPVPPQRRAGFRIDPDFDRQMEEHNEQYQQWEKQYGQQYREQQTRRNDSSKRENEDEENGEETQ